MEEEEIPKVPDMAILEDGQLFNAKKVQEMLHEFGELTKTEQEVFIDFLHRFYNKNAEKSENK